MTEKDRRILDDDMDMIKGNLNRMCLEKYEESE